MFFCCRETVDITLKTVQKKQDSCIYESCFVAVNHGYFPMMPCVTFTFRFNETHPIIFDEDSPELTPEMEKAFRLAAKTRNRLRA